MAKLLKPTNENLCFLREFLLSGGVAALPTETVYGLAANALSPEACQKVFDIKNRPSIDPRSAMYLDSQESRPTATPIRQRKFLVPPFGQVP